MSAPIMDVSVVICAYSDERWDDLGRALASARDQSLRPLEVVLIVDHNPALLERAIKAFPWVKTLPNSGIRGLSDARNAGIRACSGSIIAFLDDDATASPDWLELLMAQYADPAVIGVGGFARPTWEAGRRPGWFPEEFDWVVGCSYRGMPTQAASVRNFLGCNMSFRQEAFALAGEFDTSVGRVGTRPVGAEETEFCIRLASRAPDRQLIYEPAAEVAHRVPRQRGSWRYFRSRCYAEGTSKAIVSRIAGSRSALSTERRYTFVTLPLGVFRSLGAVVTRRDLAGPARAGAIVAGLAITTAGYVAGRFAGRQGWPARRPNPPRSK